MPETARVFQAPRMSLFAGTARELMSPSPVSIRSDASVRDLIVLLTDKGIAAAPVIDAAGHPVGVVSRADVMAHDRESSAGLARGPAQFTDSPHERGEPIGDRGAESRIRDIMTPAVFSVRPETPAARVVEEMVALNVHRLFVIDDTGVLVGVVDALDVLRHLQKESMES